MGGKGGGRFGRRKLQAHEEGGEAGEDCRRGTGSGAWAVRNLGEHVVVRALGGDGPLFVVAEFSMLRIVKLLTGIWHTLLIHPHAL